MKKVAVIRRNGFGDLLCAVPLLLYLKKRGDFLTLFVDERNAPLIPFLPHFGKVVVLPSRGNKYWKYFKIAKEYKKEFDIAISAKTSPMKLMNFFLFCLQAKERIAYVDKNWHRLLVNCPRAYNSLLFAKKHQALRGLNLMEPLWKNVPKEFYPKLFIPEELKKKYPPFSLPYPVILASCSTTQNESRLSAARYAEVLNRVHDSVPISVLVIGEEKDRARGEAIAKMLRAPHLLHFPRNFEEFMVRLDCCHLYFVGDGGVAHIGSALQKKIVAFYGRTNPIVWSPLGDDVTTFYDKCHVDNVPIETLYQALTRKTQEVMCARKHL